AASQYHVLLSSPLNISNEHHSQCVITSCSTCWRKVGSIATEARNTEKRPVRHSSFPDSETEHMERCRNPNRNEVHSANQAGPFTTPSSFVVTPETGGERRKTGNTFCSKPSPSMVSPSRMMTTPSSRGWPAAISSIPTARAGRLPLSPRKSTSSGGHKVGG